MRKTYKSRKSYMKVLLGTLAALFLATGVAVSASALPVLITTIATGTSSTPRLVAISPDGSTVYAVATTDKTLKIIDTGTNQVTGTFALPNTSETLASMAITPNGNKLYISDQHGIGASKVIVVDVSMSTPTLVTQITVGGTAYGVAISPNGSTAFVANARDNTISAIDTTTDTVSSTIPAVASTAYPAENMDFPTQIAFSPDGNSFYVTYYKDTATAAGTGIAGVVKFDFAHSNAVLAMVEYGTATAKTGSPWGIDVASNGTVYVSSYVASGSYSWIKKYDANLANPLNVDASAPYKSTIIQLSADDSLLYVSLAAAGTLNIYKTSNNALSPLTITGTGVTINDMIAPSPNVASHFAYVGTNGSVVGLIGEYLSQQRQTLTGNTGTALTSSALTAYGFSGTVTYSISPGLPAGFTFDTSTGVISGSSSTPFTATSFIITGSDGTTTAVATVTITVTTSGGGGGSGSGGASNDSSLANTGANNRLLLGYATAVGLLLMVLGATMVAARRMLKN